MPDFINLDDVDFAPFGLSAGAVAGPLVFAGGMALDLTTLKRFPQAETIADETRLCLEELDRTLKEAGCSLKDVIKINCYLTKDEFRTEFWATYDAIMDPLGVKAVRLTQVAGMACDCRVELDAVAVRQP
jgi:enamine deaminase RidA (YjgF/YER057c/UK114 family)